MRRTTGALLLSCAVWLSSCGSNASPTPKEDSSQPTKQYKIHGEIVSLDPEGNLAKIRHQKIEGWMEAMTMEFPVKDPAEYKNLHTGECIDATVNVQDLSFWIDQVKQAVPQGACVVPPAPATPAQPTQP
jgi:protein SCO1/2